MSLFDYTTYQLGEASWLKNLWNESKDILKGVGEDVKNEAIKGVKEFARDTTKDLLKGAVNKGAGLFRRLFRRKTMWDRIKEYAPYAGLGAAGVLGYNMLKPKQPQYPYYQGY